MHTPTINATRNKNTAAPTIINTIALVVSAALLDRALSAGVAATLASSVLMTRDVCMDVDVDDVVVVDDVDKVEGGEDTSRQSVRIKMRLFSPSPSKSIGTHWRRPKFNAQPASIQSLHFSTLVIFIGKCSQSPHEPTTAPSHRSVDDTHKPLHN